VPETFPDQSFDPVAGCSPPDLPFWYPQAQSRIGPVIYTGQHGEIATTGLAGLIKNVLEICCVCKSLLPGKSSTDRCGRQTSGAKALAPFGATGIDNRASSAGPHTGPKAMIAFTFEVTRLECSFHDLNHCFTLKNQTLPGA